MRSCHFSSKLPEAGIFVTYSSPSPGVILYSKTELQQPQRNIDYQVNPVISVLLVGLGLLFTALTGTSAPVSP